MNIQLHYTEHGSGEPLVLLHGNGEDSSYFEHQIAFFQDRYRVIAVDTRGHGKSPRGTAPLTLNQFADDLSAFMDELDIASAHILGFSDGANVAMLFALAHPTRVKSLVLNGGNLFPEGLTEQTRREIDEEYEQAVDFFRKAAEQLGIPYYTLADWRYIRKHQGDSYFVGSGYQRRSTAL